MRTLVVLLFVASSLGAQSTASDQDRAFALATLDGRLLRCTPRAIDPAARALVVQTDAGEQRVPLAELMAIHAAASTATARAPVVVHLVGGDQVHGELRGGDRAGEGLTIRSASLGELRVALDRLDLVRFTARAGEQDLPRLRIAADAPHAEALFVEAKRGFDTRLGEIHAFESGGLRFAAGGTGEQALWRYDELAAVALRGGVPREQRAEGLLVSRAGDRLGAELLGLRDGVLRVALEGGVEVSLPLGELAAWTPLDGAVTFLSDLPPSEVVERSWFAEGDAPLWPFRRDAAVTGGALRAGGLVFGKGLGVHARSLMTWKVPEGCTGFVGFVAMDESVRELPVRGQVAARVVLDGKPVFTLDALDAGMGLQAIGRLAVAAGQELRLEVDFGDGLDLGDRVAWGDVGFVK
ncbi:MAG: NPCBM/NEW2 domain-containing protein [Planctomycetes bacterium]|nr:NPCBM/NEW2 domain-containing protein [Planctomycetota bacterium]